MNSGEAQVFQAGHPMLLGVKGKVKGKDALAASLAGSLFSLIPGAARRVSGFEGMLRQLLGSLPEPGVQLTRKQAVAGQVPPGGCVESRLPVAAFDLPLTGLTNTTVLRSGEAVRVPQNPPSPPIPQGNGNGVPGPLPEGILPQPILPAEVEGPAVASGKASEQPGSSAELPPPGSIPGTQPALRVRSRTAGMTASRKPAEPAGTRARANIAMNNGVVRNPEAVSNSRESGVRVGTTPVITTAGDRPEPEHSIVSPRPAAASMNSRSSRSAVPPASGQPRLVHTTGDNQPPTPVSGEQRLRRTLRSIARPWAGVGRTHTEPRTFPNQVEVQLEPSRLSPGMNGKVKGRTSEITARQTLARVPLTQSERTEPGHQGTGVPVEAGRITNQGRLESSLPLPDRPEVAQLAPRASGRTSPVRPSRRRSTNPRVTRAQVDGSRPPLPLPGEDGKGKGSHPANSLTDQNGLRRPTPDGVGIERGFVRSAQVRVLRSGEHAGDESPAPLTHSLPPPAPAPVEVPANLASLARLTTLYYGRFVNSEQLNSVFTFDGGSLGNVQLTFQESNAGTTLHIMVESPEARQALQRALPNLEQQWAQQGLNFSDVNVEVGNTGEERGFPGQGNPARNPTFDSAVTDEVATDEESMGVRHYGYNTVEFVA